MRRLGVTETKILEMLANELFRIEQKLPAGV